MRIASGPRRLVVCLPLLILIAAACPRQRRATAPEKPVRGGTLVIGVDGLPSHLNPAISGGGTNTRVTRFVYQGLLFQDSDLTLHPELAERFTVKEDGKVYRFSLRRGVEWHDGRPFTSADVKFSFEKLLLEFHPRTAPALRSKLQAIDTPDPETVVFRLNEPFTAFAQLLTVADSPIVPKHVFEVGDPVRHPANDKPVGTGPFKFVSYTPESELRLERNPDYFRRGFPYLGKLVIREIPNPATLLQALETGEVDVMIDVIPSSELATIRGDPDFRLVANSFDPIGGNCSTFLGFNLDRPLFGDARLRGGIAHGIDSNRMVEEVLFGFGRVSSGPIASGMGWDHGDEVGYPEFDPVEADALLNEAGWEVDASGKRVAKAVPGTLAGSPLGFEILVREQHAKFAEIIRDQLGRLGIDVVVRGVEVSLLQDRIYTKREFDAYVVNFCQGTDPEIGLRRTIHSSAILPINASNGAGYRNPEVDALMDQAAAEPDREKRGDLYLRVQQILAQDLPYVWFAESDIVGAHTRSCAGIVLNSIHLADRAYCAAGAPGSS